MKNFYKNYLSKVDKPLFYVTLVFFIYGLLNIVTASSREAVVRYEVSTYYYFYRQLIMLFVGYTGFAIILNIHTANYKRMISYLYMIILFLIIALFKYGEEINGAKNWLSIPGLGTIQPSEFSKLIQIVFFGVIFEKFYKILKSNDPDRFYKIGYIFIIALLIPILVFFQVDLGGTIIMLGVFGFMFIASPIKFTDKVLITVSAIVVFVLACIYIINANLLNAAQLSRFNYINPCSRYELTGYQVCNSFIAINSGGLTGLGIGKSQQKYSYIPEPHTDSIFAITSEEYGFAFCTLIFIAYAFVIYRIIKISMKCQSLRNYYICIGIASYIFFHVFINIGGILGLIPLTGVPLPFLSYGGSFTITLVAALGVVQRINIENINKKDKKI